ncbi:MAG: hypothetical protein ABIO57_02315 [Candidatus Paceibacterota bacterium]
MVIKQCDVVDRLLRDSRRSAVRKQFFIIMLHRLTYLAVIVIVCAVIGDLTNIAKWYGSIPGVIFITYLYVAKNAIHYKDETIQLLQINYLAKLKQQNIQNHERVELIEIALATFQPE